jgi:hypothetical protein
MSGSWNSAATPSRKPCAGSCCPAPGNRRLLRCSKAHVCNAVAGRVPGCPPIPAVPPGRRKLVRRETSTNGAQSGERLCKSLKKLERETGFEPVTSDRTRVPQAHSAKPWREASCLSPVRSPWVQSIGRAEQCPFPYGARSCSHSGLTQVSHHIGSFSYFSPFAEGKSCCLNRRFLKWHVV